MQSSQRIRTYFGWSARSSSDSPPADLTAPPVVLPRFGIAASRDREACLFFALSAVVSIGCPVNGNLSVTSYPCGAIIFLGMPRLPCGVNREGFGSPEGFIAKLFEEGSEGSRKENWRQPCAARRVLEKRWKLGSASVCAWNPWGVELQHIHDATISSHACRKLGVAIFPELPILLHHQIMSWLLAT